MFRVLLNTSDDAVEFRTIVNSQLANLTDPDPDTDPQPSDDGGSGDPDPQNPPGSGD